MAQNKDTSFPYILWVMGKRGVELSLETTISQPRISQIKNGWARPTEKEKELIAEALGMRPDEIFYPFRGDAD